MDDRSTEDGSELILVKRRYGRLEEVACVQIVVTEKFEKRPVILIRARFTHHVHNGSGGSAVLGVEVIRDHLDFFGGVRVGGRLASGAPERRIESAIEQESTVLTA